MLKLISKYKKYLVILSFVYVYLLAIMLIPSKMDVLTPGETTNIKTVYKIEETDISNNFNSISVYNWRNVSVLQKWITENNKRYEIRETSKTLTNKEQRLQGKISNESSHNNAIITAYTYANKTDNKISLEYELKSLTVYQTTNLKLKVGDEIISVNNKEINTNSYEDYLTSLNLYRDSRYLRDDNSFNVQIKRKDEFVSVEINKTEWIYFYPKYEIIETSPKYLSSNEKLNVSGPSGGMIQAVALYYSLLDLPVPKKIRIAGTGTIETDNNHSVGKIGGVVQKYYTVLNNKMDYFIIPSSNFSELKEEINVFSNKIEVVSVNNFSDVITYLNNQGW